MFLLAETDFDVKLRLSYLRLGHGTFLSRMLLICRIMTGPGHVSFGAVEGESGFLYSSTVLRHVGLCPSLAMLSEKRSTSWVLSSITIGSIGSVSVCNIHQTTLADMTVV